MDRSSGVACEALASRLNGKIPVARAGAFLPSAGERVVGRGNRSGHAPLVRDPCRSLRRAWFLRLLLWRISHDSLLVSRGRVCGGRLENAAGATTHARGSQDAGDNAAAALG